MFNWLQEQRGTFPGFQQQLSNPQICSPHYLDPIAGKNMAKRHGLCSSRENSIERNHYYYGGVVHRPEEVNLSLTIGRNHLKTSARTKTFNHIIDLEESDETLADTKTGGRTKTWKNIIDLEESYLTVSNGELKPKSPLEPVAHVSYSGYKRDDQSTHSFNNNIKNNWFDGTPRNYFVSNSSMSCVEQNSFAEGLTVPYLSSVATNIKGKSLSILCFSVFIKTLHILQELNNVRGLSSPKIYQQREKLFFLMNGLFWTLTNPCLMILIGESKMITVQMRSLLLFTKESLILRLEAAAVIKVWRMLELTSTL